MQACCAQVHDIVHNSCKTYVYKEVLLNNQSPVGYLHQLDQLTNVQ